jgi:hypothetical protein
MTKAPALAAAVLAAALACGCGDAGDTASADASTVAQPVAPPPITDEVRTGPPPANAVEPPAGGAAAPEEPTATEEAEASGTVVADTAGGDAILSAADRESFDALAQQLGGASGIAVAPLGRHRPVQRAGDLRAGVAWSTAKVPVAMAVIAAGKASAHQGDLRQAITASDNAAALRLWQALGAGETAAQAADAQLAAAGDARTHIESRTLRSGLSPFGQTRWVLSDQARFTAGLACTRAGAQVLGLMDGVVSGQRWGLGAAGADAQFKGGWGPGSEPGQGGGYLDRQMGVVTVDGRPMAAAIATRPVDGSHETGTANLSRIARWLVEHADPSALTRRPRC